MTRSGRASGNGRSRLGMVRRGKKAPGTPPGTVVYVGAQKTRGVGMTLIEYDGVSINERSSTDLSRLEPERAGTVKWLNVDGVHDVKVVEAVGARYGLHPLVLEDIANTDQRPKMDSYDDYLFLVVKMLFATDEGFRSEQVSFVLGKDTVITFQEDPGDVFDGVRERLRTGRAPLRGLGADHLMHALLDAIVDEYFVVLEHVGDRIEELESDLIEDPHREVLHDVHRLKRQMLVLRHSVWPLRDVVYQLSRGDSPLIAPGTAPFVRDLHDHTVQVIDLLDTSKDLLTGLLELYLSSVSNRMNEVMKVLTVIATIFMPLTFIVGIYGMNFENMPELGWSAGYFVVLGVLAAVALSMVAYFRRRDWI